MRTMIESHKFDLIKEDIKRNIERSLTCKYLEHSSKEIQRKLLQLFNRTNE